MKENKHIEIENIPLKEFIVLPFTKRQPYEFAMKYSQRYFEPNSAFGFEEIFTKLTFGMVKDIQYLFENDIYWLDLFNFVDEHSEITDKELGNVGMFEWMRFHKWIKQGVTTVKKVEQQLRYETTADDENSGINELAKFGNYAQFLSIAMGNPLEIENAKKIEYMAGFTFLLYDKTLNDFKTASINNKNK